MERQEKLNRIDLQWNSEFLTQNQDPPKNLTASWVRKKFRVFNDDHWIITNKPSNICDLLTLQGAAIFLEVLEYEFTSIKSQAHENLGYYSVGATKYDIKKWALATITDISSPRDNPYVPVVPTDKASWS